MVHRHQGPNQIAVLFIKALLENFESNVEMMKSGTRVFSDLASPLVHAEISRALTVLCWAWLGGL
jgi:hypothetical protein